MSTMQMVTCSCSLLLISVYPSHMKKSHPWFPIPDHGWHDSPWWGGWSFPLSLSNWLENKVWFIIIVSLHSLSLLGANILWLWWGIIQLDSISFFCCITGHFPYISTSFGKVCVIVIGYFVAFRHLMLFESCQHLFPVWKPFRYKAEFLTSGSFEDLILHVVACK